MYTFPHLENLQDEIINIFTIDGTLIGEKGKEQVHFDGDWHKTFHLWIFFKKDNKIYQTLQVRSNNKKLYPNLIDCSVAGHYTKNEIVSDGVREVKEELGIAIEFNQMHFLGIRKSEYRTGNYSNNELQYIFLLEREIDLNEIYFNQTEVESILIVDNEKIRELFVGKIDSIPCIGNTIMNGNYVLKDFNICKEDFIPTSDSYFYNISLIISQFHKNKKTSLNIFLGILNLIDGLEFNDSKIIGKYIKSKSIIELNLEFEEIFSNQYSKERFFKALLQFNTNSKTLVEFLILSIDNVFESVKNKIFTLGWIRDKRSIQALKNLTQYKNPQVRAISIFVLGEICSSNIFKLIGKKINDDNLLVSKAACFSLGWNQGKDRFVILAKHSRTINSDKKQFVDRALKMFDV